MSTKTGKRGRPSKYTPELAAEICERLSTGEPLAQICRDEHMPSDGVVRDWQEKDEKFSHAIARARIDGFDRLAAECLQIANTPLIGEEFEETDDGKTKVKRGDMLGHRKLQIETRLKLLAKWDPKRYGDRLELAGDEKNPLAVTMVKRTIIDPKNGD